MQTLNDIHHQFASFFESEAVQPYAYLVSKKLSEGHICLSLEEVDKEKETLPIVLKNRLMGQESLLGEALISTDPALKQPFMLFNNRLYLQRYFAYETQILERILAFTEAEKSLVGERFNVLTERESLIRRLFKAAKAAECYTYPDWQLAAAVTAFLNNFTIITGGPGTGKTTTVAKILAILFSVQPDLKVALAAPTGKAAARMAESLKSARLDVSEEIKEKFLRLEPCTIHRLLKFIPDSPYFKHTKENPLNYDVVIVDESSMIDVALFSKLLDAVGPQTRLILLGDKDQLASVEAGSLFGDLCMAQEKLNLFSKERSALINSFMDDGFEQLAVEAGNQGAACHPLFEHLVELKVSHRFKGDEGIGKLSRAVIQNDAAVISGFLTNTDHHVSIDTTYSERILDSFVKGYQDYIQEQNIRLALKKLNRLRVLCAIREGDHGVYALNRRVEKYLGEKKLIELKGEFYEHRPVIINSNNYSLGLYNGDVGIVRPDDQGVLKVWFEGADGELKPVLPGLISQAETVYAMTIHKSQGSEFDQVLVALPKAENIAILTRELLYTAITRAKSSVVIQGTEELILSSAAARVKRASGILDRFIFT